MNPPTGYLRPDDGRPAWEQINAMFARHRLPNPPSSLRDELVTMFVWAQFGKDAIRERGGSQ